MAKGKSRKVGGSCGCLALGLLVLFIIGLVGDNAPPAKPLVASTVPAKKAERVSTPLVLSEGLKVENDTDTPLRRIKPASEPNVEATPAKLVARPITESPNIREEESPTSEIATPKSPSKATLDALFPTPSRKWTNADGKTALGIVLAVDIAAKVATLRTAAGQTFEGYRLSAFAEPDQAYLRDAARGVLNGRVVGVHDGDSLTLLVAGNTQYKILLESIDAPELGQEFGNKSKQGLSDLVFGKQIRVDVSGKDKYDRTLGVPWVDGKNVNHEMILRGLAWHFKEYSKDTELAAAEVTARNAKRGLWSAYGAMAPWDYRDQQRTAAAFRAEESRKSAAQPFISPTTTPSAEPKTAATPLVEYRLLQASQSRVPLV